MKKTTMEANLEKLKSEKRAKDPKCHIEDVGKWGIATYPTGDKMYRDQLVEARKTAEALSKVQSVKAQKTRKKNMPVKAQLVANRDEFERKRGTKHGWPTEVHRKFGIDRRTLKKIMGE